MNDAVCQGRHSLWKRSRPAKSVKNDNMIHRFRSLPNNRIYKLATDNLQLNVLIRSFLNTNVSQGNVRTRLRCGEIFSYNFVMQPLLSPKVKNIENRSILLKLWGRIYCPVFLTHGVQRSGWLFSNSNSDLMLLNATFASG